MKTEIPFPVASLAQLQNQICMQSSHHQQSTQKKILDAESQNSKAI